MLRLRDSATVLNKGSLIYQRFAEMGARDAFSLNVEGTSSTRLINGGLMHYSADASLSVGFNLPVTSLPGSLFRAVGGLVSLMFNSADFSGEVQLGAGSVLTCNGCTMSPGSNVSRIGSSRRAHCGAAV